MDSIKHRTPLELRYRRTNPLLTLVRLYEGQYLRLLWAAVIFCLKASPQWLTPVLVSMIVDTVAVRGDLQRAYLAGGALVALMLLNLPFHVYYSRLLSKATRRVESELRLALVRRLQQLSMAFHDSTHSGVLQAKVLRDVEAVQGLSQTFYNNVLQTLALLTLAVAMTVQKAPWIMLVFVLVIPLSAGLVFSFRGRMKASNREFHDEIEEMNSAVSEMIDMIPVTRAHGVEAAEVERVSGHLRRVRIRGIELDTLNSVFGAIAWIIFQLATFVCICATAWFVWHGKLPVGALVLYPGLFSLLLGNVSALLHSVPAIMNGFACLRSIGEVLECPDLEHNEGRRPVKKVDGAFEFRHVEFTYPGTQKPAVEDFSLQVAAGECIALVGESGSGKSTLVSLIIGFRRPTRGQLLLDGQDMQELDLRTYRRELAVVPQESVLFSGSIRDNITYGVRTYTEAQVREAVEIANLSEFVAQQPQGLDTPIGESGAKLSGGQRQRLAIARAVIRNPRVVLLDEATSALDVISEAQVQEAIERMIRHRTTFIVAHRLSTIRKANRVVVMKQGRCVEAGPQDLLLAQKGEFARLKALQV